MSKKVCCNCKRHIADVKKADVKLPDRSCWKCKYDKWQDESICLSCTNPSHGCRGWANRCPGYEKSEEK
jgi:hypothetical protein